MRGEAYHCRGAQVACLWLLAPSALLRQLSALALVGDARLEPASEPGIQSAQLLESLGAIPGDLASARR